MTRTETFLADELVSPSLTRNIVLAIAGSLALTISAKLHVPFYPVPMTMQTFAVLMIGMTFGWRLGGATVALYLAEGLAGLPVFSGTPERGIGLAYMMGPTGGFLFGFLVSAVVVGFLAERRWDRGILSTLAAMALGTAIILVFGVLYLGALIGWDKPVLELGLTPFLPGAVFKILLATALLPLAWRFIGARREG
ncbi:biotin transporter BioY [Acuticoccus mangrovi]|uniref:Biotin transporter n=1 Tax=Acuticoccus mangrovi TaxID=2796142 RepID=A0A934MF91_9HYPH|nr:biotin transporter BioY [Acuticoccus mangrovi]MBJ3775213.1 biotin transporter BioY [Acuticoccus mangrovi]